MSQNENKAMPLCANVPIITSSADETPSQIQQNKQTQQLIGDYQ